MVSSVIPTASKVTRSEAPCASIWDLRQPDGSAYPPHQLSAAVKAIQAAGGSVPAQDNEAIAAAVGKKLSNGRGSLQLTSGGGLDDAGLDSSAQSETTMSDDYGVSSSSSSHLDEQRTRSRPDDSGVGQSVQSEGLLSGPGRDLIERAVEGVGEATELPGGAGKRWRWGAEAAGEMSRSIKTSLSLAVFLVTFVVVKTLFGRGVQRGGAGEVWDRAV